MIWIGGLVTSYKSGMAAPEGFSTYGYNLFLYPLRAWLAAPWDLFIEHGHRLWGHTVGIVTIGFVIAVWLRDSRGWMRACSLGALAGVVFQGVLGALRVNFDAVTLARVHGCFGPAFFAFATALAVCESRGWREWGAGAEGRFRPPGRLVRLGLATAALAYAQLVLGSLLRHVAAGVSPEAFRLAVLSHVAVAFLLAFAILWLAWGLWRAAADRSALPAEAALSSKAALSARGSVLGGARGWLLRPAAALVMLVTIQLTLGLGAWVSKYGWPQWLADGVGPARTEGFVVLAAGRGQAWITTAHVAVGSLILATSVMLALRSSRLAFQPRNSATETPPWREAAA